MSTCAVHPLWIPEEKKKSEGVAIRRKNIPAWLEVAAANAPVAPPCFESRSTWVGYLESAQLSGIQREMPFRVKRGKVSFRSDFDFCADCTSCHRKIMQDSGRCNPRHLKDMAKDAEVEQA